LASNSSNTHSATHSANHPANAKKLQVIPLGGLGEIGKNMTVLRFGNDILVIDAGLMFPTEDMLGIDLVIPDITYLLENRDCIKGIVLTHGHEDHIGALPYVLTQIDVPVYGTPLTLGILKGRLEERGVSTQNLHPIMAGDQLRLGGAGADARQVPGRRPVQADELIDLGAGQPAAGDQMVQPLPLIPVGGGEGIDIHGRSVS